MHITTNMYREAGFSIHIFDHELCADALSAPSIFVSKPGSTMDWYSAVGMFLRVASSWVKDSIDLGLWS